MPLVFLHFDSVSDWLFWNRAKDIFFILTFQRLVVMKLDRLKTCFGHEMAADEFKPDEIAAGVKKVYSVIFYFFKVFF